MEFCGKNDPHSTRPIYIHKGRAGGGANWKKNYVESHPKTCKSYIASWMVLLLMNIFFSFKNVTGTNDKRGRERGMSSLLFTALFIRIFYNVP